MKLSVSLHAAIPGKSLTTEQKLRMAAELGYSAVEFWAWWEEDVEAVAKTAAASGLEIASVCTRFVSLVDPSAREQYLEGIAESIEAARRLGCRYLISQTGNAIPGVSREEQTASLIEGLQAAGKLLEGTDITLIVEPLNILVDHPGYFLVHADEAADIIRRVDCPQVKLVYDVYHQQVSEGNLIPTIRKHMDTIAYFHIADHPGRHEPGTGEIHYTNVLQAIRDEGYNGYVGLEYFPQGEPDAALKKVLEEYGAFND